MLKRNRLAVFVAILKALLTLIAVIGNSCSPAVSKLSVFAADGAKPAIDEICQRFENQYEIKIEVSYGGGGEVLNQMILSRSGDVYVAPEQKFMETAKERQAIDSETIESVAYMIPVIAVRKGNPKNIVTLADLTQPGVRVAITRPETTLLGKYAPEIFSKAGLVEAIEKNIVAQATRPDSLLAMLVMDQVDTVVIWHFYQVLASEQIEVVFLAPEQLTGIGEMQVALSAFCKDRRSAQQFINFITSADGKTVFKELGYLVDAQEVKKYWR